ncbi:helix-turn-helix domain-containing protein [Streptomyces sp. NPDC057555]|uniref:helix-turn-helix domain-containing protein n=1 Tax=Streptomyces sp. NPDC057555 TaxID=3346166 RepID=UPI003691D8A5
MLCHTSHMTSAQTSTPVMRRRLGGILRRYRNEAAMTLAQAASCVGWESTRLSRVETGQYPDQGTRDLNALGGVCGQ